jgi:hypothetical protein
MKKKLIFAVILSAFTASSAFALTITSAGTSLGGGTYKPSTGVTVVVFTNGTSGAFDGTVYAGGSANVQGKKEYATNSSDPKIYYKDATTAGTPSVDSSAWAASGDWKDK